MTPTEVPEEERAAPTKDELVGPLSPIWCCERTGTLSSMAVGGECPVHGGDACLARYDHHTTIDRITKELDEARAALDFAIRDCLAGTASEELMGDLDGFEAEVSRREAIYRNNAVVIIAASTETGGAPE